MRLCVGKKDRDVYYSARLDSSYSDPSSSNEVFSYSDLSDSSESWSSCPIGSRAAGDGGVSTGVAIEGRGVAQV
jgi:hypothetical protein